MSRSLQVLVALLQVLVFHGLATAQSESTVKLSSPCKALNEERTLKRQLPVGDIETSVSQRGDSSPAAGPIQLTNTIENSKPLLVEFDGLNALDKRHALKGLCDKGAFSNSEANTVESTLKEMLWSVGYPHAQVRSFFDQQSLLRVFVDEGAPVPLAQLRFHGNKFFPEKQLLTNVRKCLERTRENATPTYNEEIVEYCGRLLAHHLRDFGYLQARVVRKTELRKVGYRVSYTVHEGPQYRLGKVRISGMEALTEEQVRSKLVLRDGDVASSDKIAKWLFEELKKLYGDTGFIEYTAEIIPTFQEEQRIVDFDIKIDEGKKFTLRSITFIGQAIPGFDLESVLLIRAGDTYHETLFRQSIARLNGLGLFAPIDSDRDVDFSSNQEQALVAVTIKLNKQK